MRNANGLGSESSELPFPRQRCQKSLLAFLTPLEKSASAWKYVVAFYPRRVFQGIEIHEEREVK